MSVQAKTRTAAVVMESDEGRTGSLRPVEKRTITVAVAGNPNAGKSTLINAIAGTRLQVGNWAGVTVEKKEASFEFQGRKIRLVDLPGTYSLSPYTQEEIIARDYLVHERPDLIINVVDATNLERNLYLTIQLMELGIPVVMALNTGIAGHNPADDVGRKSRRAGLEGPEKEETMATHRQSESPSQAASRKDESFRLVISSRQLMGNANEVIIEHSGEEYRLRITRQQKLILTK